MTSAARAVGAVGSAALLDGSVSTDRHRRARDHTAKLADRQRHGRQAGRRRGRRRAKIADATVAAAKLADGSVETADDTASAKAKTETTAPATDTTPSGTTGAA